MKFKSIEDRSGVAWLLVLARGRGQRGGQWESAARATSRAPMAAAGGGRAATESGERQSSGIRHALHMSRSAPSVRVFYNSDQCVECYGYDDVHAL